MVIQQITLHSPCHLVPSIRWILATVIVSLLHAFRSLVVSLSSGRFILIVSCISSIHLFLGRPLPRFPSPHASIISFSMPSARITWPKYVTFCLVALCLNDISPLKCPISSSICSFVLFSVQDTLSILLQIHISHASIFFSSALVFVHASHPYSTTGIIMAFTILVFVSRLTALSFHIFSKPCIAPFPRVILRRISLSHPPSLSPFPIYRGSQETEARYHLTLQQIITILHLPKQQHCHLSTITLAVKCLAVV